MLFFMQELFSSKTKYDSHSGWPSFYDVIEQSRVVLFEDLAEGMHRIEGWSIHVLVVCMERVYGIQLRRDR